MKLRNFLKHMVKRIPLLRKPAYILVHVFSGAFPGSGNYWESRYVQGGDSGPGSMGHLAEFKAEILNAFVRTNKLKTVMEFGCGDGNQLELACYPYYIGFDVSPAAIALCKKKYSNDETRTFKLMSEYNGDRAQLTLSLDVIYHLVEDHIFYQYMNRLFSSSDIYVIIYSSNMDENVMDQPKHIKHRKVTEWIEANTVGWKLIEHIPNKYPYNHRDGTGSFADFFIYKKKGGEYLTDENSIHSIR